jgi:ribosomal protein S27AE
MSSWIDPRSEECEDCGGLTLVPRKTDKVRCGDCHKTAHPAVMPTQPGPPAPQQTNK